MAQGKHQHLRGEGRWQNTRWHRLTLLGVLALVTMLITGSGLFFLALLTLHETFKPDQWLWQVAGASLLPVGIWAIWMIARLAKAQLSQTTASSSLKQTIDRPALSGPQNNSPPETGPEAHLTVTLDQSRQDLTKPSSPDPQSPLKQTNRQLPSQVDEHLQMEAELKTRVRQQAAVAELGQRALVGTDPAALMGEATCLIADALNVSYITIFELNPYDDTLLLQAEMGWPEPVMGHLTLSAQIEEQAAYTLQADGPVIINNLAQETRFLPRPLLREHGVVSSVSMVIQKQEQLFGILEVHTITQHTFTENELHFLKAIANVLALAIDRKNTNIQQAAIAIENARLFRQVRSALEETAALYRVTKILAQMDNEQEMFELLLTEYLQFLSLQQGGILIFDQDKVYGTLKARMVGGELVEPGLRIKLTGIPFYDQLIDNHKPLAIRDAINDKLAEPVRELNKQLGIKSLLLVPIVVRGEVIGSLGADTTSEMYVFKNREISFGRAMADQLAIAIENNWLYAEMKRRTLHLSVLQELDRALTHKLGRDDIYHIFARHAGRLLAYDRMSIALLERDEVHLVFVADKNESQHNIQVGAKFPVKKSATGRAISQGQLILRHNITTNTQLIDDQLLAARGIQSIMMIPLKVKGEVIGTLNIGSEQLGAYSPDDLQLAQMMSEQLAIAIENARLYHEIHQYLEELTTLNMISQIITSTLDLQEMLTIITRHTMQLLNVAATSVALYDETKNELWFAAASGAGADYIREKRLPSDKGIIGWVTQHSEPVLVPDASKDPRTFHDFDEKSGFQSRSILCVPLQTKGQTIGAIEALNKEGVFDEEDLRLLSSLAGAAATAIENARLYEQAQQEIKERVRAEEALQETIERLEMANKQAMIYAQELKEEIIERKRAEAALQEERALLAQRVTERTADLRAANEELARAGRLKDEFLASMSHELRTPLSAVLGLTEVLQSEIYGPLNPKQHKSLTSVEESGRHLLALINDILDLSKIGAGKLELQIGVVPVAAVCQASLRLIREAAHKKRIKVSKKLDTSITILQADERRLKQILINLLSNAVKFTPEGGEVGLEIIGDAVSQEAHFIVWDTGIGISQEDIDRLFMPFVQLDGSLSRHYSGTGLGLALVERMVKLHDGYISVESEIGRGSRFTVSLPWIKQTKLIERSKPEAPPTLARPELSYAAAKPAPLEMAMTPPAAAKNIVLLVEDDQDMADFMQNYLNVKGYQTITARDGLEAIAKAKAEKPDMILMDVQMPEMNGLEAIRHIRAEANPNLAATPIIAITALAMSGDRERCLEAGANAYLSKPLKLQELVEAIEAQLHKNRVGEQGLI